MWHGGKYKKMEIGYNVLSFCAQFIKYIDRNKIVHIVYGSNEALALLSKSPQALIDSNCLDYFITVMGNRKEPDPKLLLGAFPVHGHSVVSEVDYKRIHKALGGKFREITRR